MCKEENQRSWRVTNIFLQAKLKTKIDKSYIREFLEGTTVELSQKKEISLSMKSVQCWDSLANFELLGLNNSVCPVGNGKVLEHKLKEIEKRLIRNKKLKDEQYQTPPECLC